MTASQYHPGLVHALMRRFLIPDIRTYAVMPLNEECGMLEWVNNTVALRPILTRLYEARGVKIFVSICVVPLWCHT